MLKAEMGQKELPETHFLSLSSNNFSRNSTLIEPCDEKRDSISFSAVLTKVFSLSNASLTVSNVSFCNIRFSSSFPDNICVPSCLFIALIAFLNFSIRVARLIDDDNFFEGDVGSELTLVLLFVSSSHMSLECWLEVCGILVGMYVSPSWLFFNVWGL